MTNIRPAIFLNQPIYKVMLAVFVVSFVILAYMGMKHPDHTDLFLFKNVVWAQIGTFVYFAFFLGMPFYTKIDSTKPVPERVTS